MKYLKSVTEYCFKNILFLSLFAIIPAVFVGLLLHPFQFIEFLFHYSNLGLNNFSEVFYALIPFDLKTILFAVLGLFITSVFMSVLLGKIETHLRLGKKVYKLTGNDFNNNFLSVFVSLLCAALCYFVILILGAILVFVTRAIFAKVMAVGTVFCVIIILLCLFAISFVSNFFALVALDMMIMGSPFRVAISFATSAIHKSTFQNIFIGLIPFLIACVLTILGTVCGVLWLSNILSLMVIILFVSTFSMIMFFDYYGLERYDTRPYYNLR